MNNGKQRLNETPTTNLEPNIAAFLSYLGVFITGVIFLILEQRNKFVRFHAIQSIIIFGFLFIASGVLSQIPYVGWFFSLIFGVLIFVLWIVLMVKAYQGEIYKIPVAGDIAEQISKVGYDMNEEQNFEKDVNQESQVPHEPEQPVPAVDSGKGNKTVKRVEDETLRNARSGRITSSSFAIAWSIVFLILFHFFEKYIAYYNYESPNWVRYQVLTDDFSAWLPIITTILILSIVGHGILIAFDRYVLRETTLIVLNLFGIAAVVTLISIFPFDFTVIPDSVIADILPIITMIVLIGIAIGLGIGTLVTFIKLIVNVARGNTSY
jgi:uncharacterized membrane protein